MTESGVELRRSVVSARTLNQLEDVFAATRAHVDASLDAGFAPDSQARSRREAGSYGFETAFRIEELRPRAIALLKALLQEAGLVSTVRQRLGPDFVVCVAQSMFRWRSPHKSGKSLGWHQDGKFYGEGIRSMNVWIPMRPCGRSGAPGLDFIDGLTDLAPGQAYGKAGGEIATGYDAYVATLDPARIQSPDYAPGDVLVFNQHTLHRTTPIEDFSTERVSLELRFLSRVATSMLFGMNLRSDDLEAYGML